MKTAQLRLLSVGLWAWSVFAVLVIVRLGFMGHTVREYEKAVREESLEFPEELDKMRRALSSLIEKQQDSIYTGQINMLNGSPRQKAAAPALPMKPAAPQVEKRSSLVVTAIVRDHATGKKSAMLKRGKYSRAVTEGDRFAGHKIVMITGKGVHTTYQGKKKFYPLK